MATKARDTNGRFVEGCAPGPGRPRRAVEADYLKVLTEVCTLEAFRAICERAVEKAKHGDRWARDWLSRYLLGEPTHVDGTVDMDTTRLIDLAATEADPKLIPDKIAMRRRMIDSDVRRGDDDDDD